MAEDTDLLRVNTGLRLEETNRCQIVVGQTFIGDCLPVPCRLPSTSFVEHKCSYTATSEAICEKKRTFPIESRDRFRAEKRFPGIRQRRRGAIASRKEPRRQLGT